MKLNDLEFGVTEIILFAVIVIVLHIKHDGFISSRQFNPLWTGNIIEVTCFDKPGFYSEIIVSEQIATAQKKEW